MSRLGSLTLSAQRFAPVSQTDVRPFVAAAVALAVAAVLLCVIVMALGRPRRVVPAPGGVHRRSTGNDEWLRQIDDVRERFHAGEIDEDDAFSELAGIARRFASSRLGRDVTSHTLAELRTLPRSRGNGRGLDLLRQTISALYPPEFAGPFTHAHADASVDDAAGWVARLVERWRA
ncbi:hypothetical protein CS006_09415 [Bifidobacterium primatium]|uniref:Uncharacterized protein n=1 Tax=Bifidobacterium primatium TaxID=2045438 RepID=A0A2M9H7I4_9BIFI|nr:hypothetical protein CS006_09415 [Bifidobacterium primatium]